MYIDYDKFIKKIIMDNQFLSTPHLGSKTKINSARDRLQKDELIRGLELKNNKLRTQIIKIQNVIDEQLKDEPEEKAKQRKPIMRSEENQQVITKQLSNAYKKIKMYEYEISKFQESQASIGTMQVQKAKQIESIIKEKKSMGDKLKMKLQQEQKSISQNIKKLSNNNGQQEIEKKIKATTDQIKFLRQKLKEQQTKDQIKQTNMRKQYEFIKKLQNQLLQSGMSPGELDQIKQRAIKKAQPTQINQSNVTRLTPLGRSKEEALEEIIQQKTIDNYRQLKSQVKLLQKMQSDYERKINQAEIQKQKAIRLNSDSRDRLLQIEDEIQRLEKQILVQKGKVIPSNMKPLRPLRSVSSYMSSEKDRKIPAKNLSVNKGSKTLAHVLKFDEVGMTSEKGQRFTDRNILGKKNLYSKITGFTVFLNNQTGAIGGIQAVYINKKGGEYVKKDRQTRQQQYRQEKIVCSEGEWLKSVTGTLNQQDKLQSLYVITNKGQSKRFGQPKTTKKTFSFDIAPDQVPVCIFGSLLVFKEVGKPQHSIVEHFGIQINSEHHVKGQNSYQFADV